MKHSVAHKKRCHPEFQEEVKRRKCSEIITPAFKKKNKRTLESLDSLECYQKSKRCNTNLENKANEFKDIQSIPNDFYLTNNQTNNIIEDTTKNISIIEQGNCYPANSQNNSTTNVNKTYDIYNAYENVNKIVKNSNELAIIPFEENDDKIFMIQKNNRNKFILKASDLKMILNLLPRKNILYKNLSYLIKNNKPLIIDEENFNMLIQQLKNEDIFHKIGVFPNVLNNWSVIEDQKEPEIDMQWETNNQTDKNVNMYDTTLNKNTQINHPNNFHNYPFF